MKLTWFGKIVFFVLSYYFLFVIILYDNIQLKRISVNLYYFSLGLNWIICIILTIFVLCMTLYIFYQKKLPKKVFEIVSIQNLSAETLNYLVTVILGLFFFNSSLISIKVIILILLLYLVYQTGGIYYLQPILILFGYKVYKCKIEGENEIMLIGREDQLKKGKREVNELFLGVYITKISEDE